MDLFIRRAVLLFATTAVLLAQRSNKPPAPPEQPLPFSHKTHISVAKLNCQDCHTYPVNFGDGIGIPTSNKCMACHVAIAKDRPAIQKLAALAKTGKAIPWVQVFGLPDFVFFDHKYHLQNGATCVDCHGATAEQDVTANEINSMNMNHCQACHARNKAANGCGTCHNHR